MLLLSQLKFSRASSFMECFMHSCFCRWCQLFWITEVTKCVETSLTTTLPLQWPRSSSRASRWPEILFKCIQNGCQSIAVLRYAWMFCRGLKTSTLNTNLYCKTLWINSLKENWKSRTILTLVNTSCVKSPKTSSCSSWAESRTKSHTQSSTSTMRTTVFESHWEAPQSTTLNRETCVS